MRAGGCDTLMTMDREGDQADGTPPPETEDEPDAWYFNLPQGAWERQEAKNRALRDSIRHNISRQTPHDTRSPYEPERAGRPSWLNDDARDAAAPPQPDVPGENDDDPWGAVARAADPLGSAAQTPPAPSQHEPEPGPETRAEIEPEFEDAAAVEPESPEELAARPLLIRHAAPPDAEPAAEPVDLSGDDDILSGMRRWAHVGSQDDDKNEPSTGKRPGKTRWDEMMERPTESGGFLEGMRQWAEAKNTDDDTGRGHVVDDPREDAVAKGEEPEAGQWAASAARGTAEVEHNGEVPEDDYLPEGDPKAQAAATESAQTSELPAAAAPASAGWDSELEAVSPSASSWIATVDSEKAAEGDSPWASLPIRESELDAPVWGGGQAAVEPHEKRGLFSRLFRRKAKNDRTAAPPAAADWDDGWDDADAPTWVPASELTDAGTLSEAGAGTAPEADAQWEPVTADYADVKTWAQVRATAALEATDDPSEWDPEPVAQAVPAAATPPSAPEPAEVPAGADDDPWASFVAGGTSEDHDGSQSPDAAPPDEEATAISATVTAESAVTPADDTGPEAEGEPARDDPWAAIAAASGYDEGAAEHAPGVPVTSMPGVARPLAHRSLDLAAVDRFEPAESAGSETAEAVDVDLDVDARLDADDSAAGNGAATLDPVAGTGWERTAAPGEPAWSASANKELDDVVLRAFEAHANTRLDDDELDDGLGDDMDPRSTAAFRGLLGDAADDLDEHDHIPTEDQPVFTKQKGWAPQRNVASTEHALRSWTLGMGPPQDLTGGAADAPWPNSEGEDGAGAPPWDDGIGLGEGAVPRRGSRGRTIVRELVETGLLALLVFLSVRSSFQNFKVDGTSMSPTLENGEFLIVNKLIYSEVDLNKLSNFLPFIHAGDDPTRNVFHGPERGDIIVLKDPRNPNVDLIKRVIGLPGETVQIENGQVYINDMLLEEPYITTRWFDNKPKVTIPADEYYVLGDNRSNSLDSRSTQVGFVHKDLIIGKALLSYWPTSKFGLAPNHSPELTERPILTTQRIDGE